MICPTDEVRRFDWVQRLNLRAPGIFESFPRGKYVWKIAGVEGLSQNGPWDTLPIGNCANKRMQEPLLSMAKKTKSLANIVA